MTNLHFAKDKLEATKKFFKDYGNNHYIVWDRRGNGIMIGAIRKDQYVDLERYFVLSTPEDINKVLVNYEDD